MLNLKKLFGASILAVASAMPAYADMVLDTFDYYTDPSHTTSSGSFYFNADTTDGGLFPSGATVGFSEANGVTSYLLEATGAVSLFNPTVETGNGQMIFGNTSENVDSTLAINYADPFGGTTGGINFASQGNYIYLDVVSASPGADANDVFEIAITVTDADGGVGVSILDITDTILNETLLLSFNSFVGGVDFSSVVNVAAVLTTTGAADLTLSEVGIVPEPGTLAIFGLGLLGLAGAARRRNA